MQAWTRLHALAVPMPGADIDTDIIFPARFLLLTEKTGLGRHAFHDQRYDTDGRERPGFVLNQPAWQGAAILVAGANFGCGSSREQAPWALADLGLRCIVAPSFGEIFAGNCIANGLLPVVLTGTAHAQVLAEAEAARPCSVDLVACTVELADGRALPFALPEARRQSLLTGTDEIDRIRRDESARIAAFETRQQRRMPWLFDPPSD